MSKDITPEIFDQLKDSMGRFRTMSLFKEHSHPSYPAFFTLKRYGADGYISMYEKYMEIADPTEYEVAIKLLGSWEHWQALSNANWFNEILTGWRKELKTKLASQRFREMEALASRGSATATKWLDDEYSKKERKRGRPSKEEKMGYLKREREERSELEQDAKIVGIGTK